MNNRSPNAPPVAATSSCDAVTSSRHLQLAAVLALCACSPARVDATSAPVVEPLDVATIARRGFVVDGARLVNDQPQWRAAVSTTGALEFSAQAFERAPAPVVLSVRLATVRRGGTELPLEAGNPASPREGRLERSWGAVTEWLEAREGHLEQSFSFERAPEGQGPLEVELRVEGFTAARVDVTGAHFTGAEGSVGVRYGHGTWVDAHGVRTSLPLSLDGDRLRFRVPASVLDEDCFPAVLDPLLDPEVTFPDGGTMVPAPRAQRAPAIGTSDAGWLVVWEDARHVLYRGTDLYATRVNFDGGVLDPEGIPLSTAPGDQTQPQVSFNGENWVVAWIDRRAGNHPYAAFVTPAGAVGPERKLSGNNVDLSAPQVASNGALTLITWGQVGLWGTQVFNDGGLSHPDGFQVAPFPFASSRSLAWNGEAFVTTSDGNGTMAMFILPDAGLRAFPLADGGSTTRISLTTETGNDNVGGRTISLTPMTGGRVAAIWPRSNAGQWPADVHAAVIDADGGATEFRLRTSATDPWLAGYQVRAAFDGQRVVGCVSGARDGIVPGHAMTVALLADAGIGPVVTITTDAGQPNVECALGSGPGVVLAAYVATQEYEPTIRYQVLTGDFTTPSLERVLSMATNPQELPAVARSGVGSRPWMIAWSDARTPYSGFDVYAQLLSNPGGVTAGAPFRLSARPADEVGVRLLGAGSDGYVATWSEGTPLNSDTISSTRAMRISAAGVPGPVLDLLPGGPYSTYQAPTATLEGRTVVISSGYNSFNANTAFDGWSFSLDSDAGVVRTGYSSVPARSGLRLAPHGAGVLAAWDDGLRIQGTLLFDGGTTQGPVFQLVDAANPQVHVALSPTADGTLLAWEDWRSNTPRIYAGFFRTDGGLSTAAPISDAPGEQRNPTAITLGDGRSVIAWEQQTTAGTDVYATFLSPQGTSLNPTGVPWAGDAGATQNLRPVLASDGNALAMLTWNRLSEDGRRLSAAWRTVRLGAAVGGTCTSTTECSEGFCVDGRCCNGACGGSDPFDCQACSITAGATTDGVCALLATTHLCRPSRDAVCDTADYCEGNTDCPDTVTAAETSCSGGHGVCDGVGTCAIEDCVRNLVGYLVGVAFGYGLGCE